MAASPIDDGVEAIAATSERLVDRLVREYAPDSDIYDVVLPEGEVLKFRALKGYGDLAEFKRALIDWSDHTPLAGAKAAKGHIWESRLPKNTFERTAAFTIAYFSHEPQFTHVDALDLLKAPWLVEYLMNCIESANKTMRSMFESKLVEASKKGSGETGGSASSSSSPETVSESTPTP